MKTHEQRSLERLRHILEAIDLIQSYITDIDQESFLDDRRTNEAVLFRLSVIGEAIIHVEREILDRHPYPWHQVRAMRNVITHQYFGIKMEIIWNTVENDLPQLKEMVAHIIDREF
ncbi:MAG: DUF86 domain-containing protein [Flavobacteriales bacterium]|nr:DUF86 domain-containing protein [Flavobacteriales bacterium]